MKGKIFSMVPIILKSNMLCISTQNNGYYLLLIIKSTFTVKYCPFELSSRQQNVGGNFHRRVYSKWEKMVEKLNEIFSLVIKCRWKFSWTFLVCLENVDEHFPNHVLQIVKCRWKFSSTLKFKMSNSYSFATQNYTLSNFLPACFEVW